MKKKIVFFFFCWFLVIASFYLPEKRFSEFENRYLETFSLPKMDEVISLEWMDDFETALCEQFNFRNISITIKTYMDRFLGQTDNGRVYFGKDSFLMGIEDTTNAYLDANIETLNTMANSTSTPIDFIPVYGALCVLNKYAPDYVESQQLKVMQYLKTNLKDIHIVDLYDTLKGNTDYYYRTDHHWTLLGAKAAYEFYSNNPVDENVIEVKNDFLGTLYHQAPTLNAKPDIIYGIDSTNIIAKYSDGSIKNSYFNEDMLDTHDAYRYYLNGNYERIDIETQTKNGKSILIIKDSYANTLIPFLNNDYEFITVIDLRYGNTDMLSILNEGYDKCLVLYEIGQFCNDEYFSLGVK